MGTKAGKLPITPFQRKFEGTLPLRQLETRFHQSHARKALHLIIADAIVALLLVRWLILHLFQLLLQ
jgi:hypothetical protein